MSASCATCEATTGDGTLLCNLCTGELRDSLAATAWLDAELEVTFLRQDRFGSRVSLSRSAEKPLVWNDRAARMRDELNLVLGTWVGVLTGHGRDRGPTPELGDWLARNLNLLRAHPDAGAGHHELSTVLNRAKVVVDRPAELLAYGVCDFEGCTGFLYAPPGRESVICRKCGSEHLASDRREWMLAYMRQKDGTATEVAGMLRAAGVTVTANAVRKMGDSNRVPSIYVDDSAGRKVRVFRVSEVLDAVANRYRRKAKSK